MKPQKTYASIFDLNGIPRLGQAAPLALQHVVAMIVGCITPAIIISGAAGLDSAERIILTQAALVVSAISTLLQLFPFIKGGSFQLGAGLPVIMGISFAYVPSMQAIAETFDVATILGAQIVGGIIAVMVGILVKKIRPLFPPSLPVRSFSPLASLSTPLPSTTWRAVQATQATVPGRIGW